MKWKLVREALSIIRPVRSLQRVFTRFDGQLREYEEEAKQMDAAKSRKNQ